ncbi:MAG: hypothetical protein JWO58_2134 [Chitinophagaceae bacterium]|nr:hypothetical protein [Chitinophagaceae bacterium]
MSTSSMVEFQCIKKPDIPSLSGFKVGEKYTGRTFNGVYLITPVWGGADPTMIIDGKQFTAYFQVVNKRSVNAVA